MAASTPDQPDPAPVTVVAGPAVPEGGGFVLPAAPVEVAEPTSKQPVVLATENHLTEFVAGDVRVTHAGVAVGKKQADELTETAARHGVRLIDITPEQKD